MGAQLFCTQCGAAGSVGQGFCATCGNSLGGPPDPLLGTMLGPFRLDAVIAAGGFGVVYRAYDTKLERNVALKLLREELAVDEEFRTRFLRESRAAAGLDHQNILPMFDAGEIDGVLYIATRLVDGVDLRRRLAREGLFSVDRALAIVHQIGVALDFAHGKGLVHRDVKPANILLVAGQYGDDEHAYLIDFGITKNVEADRTLTMTGHFVGTPEYVAPEQIVNDRIDGRADQYALACVLHHCLTGSPPFQRDTTVDVLFAHMHAEPPRPSAVNATLPESVDNAIMRALSKDPKRRYETCRAFIAAARAGTGAPTPQRATAAPPPTTFVPQSQPPPGTPLPPMPEAGGEPTDPAVSESPQSPAPPPPAAGTGSGGRRRPPVVLALLAVIVVGALVGGGLLLTLGQDEDDPSSSASTSSPRPPAAAPAVANTDPGGEIVDVLTRYESAYTSQDIARLRFVFTPDVTRRGLRSGGCAVDRGREDVLQSYREQFSAGTGAYTLRGLNRDAVDVAASLAVVKLGYSIGGGGSGSVEFALKPFKGKWRISHVRASCR